MHILVVLNDTRGYVWKEKAYFRSAYYSMWWEIEKFIIIRSNFFTSQIKWVLLALSGYIESYRLCKLCKYELIILGNIKNSIMLFW